MPRDANTSGARDLSRVRNMCDAGNTYLARNAYLARNTGGRRAAKAARPSAASWVPKQIV